MPDFLNKFYNYNVFIGPCQSGLNFYDHSGNFVSGPVKDFENYGIAEFGYWVPTNVSLSTGDYYAKENVLRIVPTAPFDVQILSKDLDITGWWKIDGQVYIPSDNLGIKKVAIVAEPSQTVFLFSGENSWRDISFYDYIQPSSLKFMLLNRFTPDNPLAWASGASGYTGDNVYLANFSMILDSGVGVPEDKSYINLIQNLQRIQNVSISTNFNRDQFTDFGSHNLQSYNGLFYPQGTVGIDYLQFDLSNEVKLGFNVNVNHPSGTALYTGYNYNLLSRITGDVSRSGFYSNFTFPWNNVKYQNLYINVNNNDEDNSSLLLSSGADDYNNTYTLGLGNCFLQSYKVSAQTRSLPSCSVQYGFYNLTTQDKSFGISPCVEPISGLLYTGSSYWLPKPNTSSLRSVFSPSDIFVNIMTRGKNYFNITGLKIDGFDLSIDFNQQILESMGYNYPKSYETILPLLASLNINGMVTQKDYFQLQSAVRSNDSMDVQIYYVGCDGTSRGRVLQYDFKGCYLDSIQDNFVLGEVRGVGLSITQEISQGRIDHGLFMSGHIWPTPQKFINNVNQNNHRKSIDFIYNSGTAIYTYGN